MWTLGLVLWLFDRDRHPIIDSLKAKFRATREIAEANVAALNAAMPTARPPSCLQVRLQNPKSKGLPGTYSGILPEQLRWPGD